ncbi:efflux RND transporter periplasmic adaptor subunit [bacterium]|nr:efflux RND transporter periplasmic adaptor subunit [bacterium]
MSPKTLRNVVTAVAILVLGLMATGVLIKMARKPERKTPPASRPVVAVITVPEEATPVQIRSFGSVRAKRSVTIVPQVSGEVLAKSAAFESGSFITAGEVLLRIDDTDYVMAAATARSNVAQAEVNLAMAEEEAAVAVREWERLGGEGTPSDLVLRKPQLQLAEAGLEAARAAQAQAEVNLSRCTIRAPFDGRVLAADVDAGQYLRAGNPVGTVYATDLAEVVVSIADADMAWIQVSATPDPAGVPVDVSAEFGGRRHHWAGRAVRLGGAVDERSRLVPVVVEIPDPYRRDGDRPALVEGMFVEVLFSTPPAAGSVVIPRAALRPDDVVWVVGGEGRLDVRGVTVARADARQAVIVAGLAPGERVCTSNLQYVTDGMPVRVEGDPAPAGRGGGQPGEGAGGAAADAKDGGK